MSELAERLGRTPSWVSERLVELRSELLLQTGLFFPLTDTEYDALRDSIERNGVQAPIIIGEHIPLLDGRHRLLIAEELGLQDIPAVFVQDLTPEQERELAISLNATRRQLNRAQRRKLVEAELMRDPARSDRMLASIAGVSPTTVGAIRGEIAQQQRAQTAVSALDTNDATTPISPGSPKPDAPGQITPRVPVDPPQRIGRDGVAQPVPERPIVLDGQEKRLGYVECAHGHRHALYRDGAGYRIESA